MTIGVFGRSAEEKNIKALKSLVEACNRHGVNLFLYKKFKSLHPTNKFAELETFDVNDSNYKKLDYLFSVGGDGTMLNTVHIIRNRQIPLVGINTGRLGFLSNFTSNELDEVVELVKNKKYEEDHRTLIEVSCNHELLGNDNIALNEFTLQKRDPSAVIEVHAFLNGEFLSSYFSDGVIVSTPTGSTAYAMSTGGPIILPGTGSFVISPIAPHALTLRPIVVSNNSILKFKVVDRRGDFYCTIDSHSWLVQPDYEFTVKKADYTINIVRKPDNTYINTLRNKLMWGADSRNK